MRSATPEQPTNDATTTIVHATPLTQQTLLILADNSLVSFPRGAT